MKYITKDNLIKILKKTVPILQTGNVIIEQTSNTLLSILSWLEGEQITVKDDQNRAMLPGHVRQMLVESLEEDNA